MTSTMMLLSNEYPPHVRLLGFLALILSNHRLLPTLEAVLKQVNMLYNIHAGVIWALGREARLEAA